MILNAKSSNCLLRHLGRAGLWDGPASRHNGLCPEPQTCLSNSPLRPLPSCLVHTGPGLCPFWQILLPFYLLFGGGEFKDTRKQTSTKAPTDSFVSSVFILQDLSSSINKPYWFDRQNRRRIPGISRPPHCHPGPHPSPLPLAPGSRRSPLPHPPAGALTFLTPRLLQKVPE